MPDQEAVQMNLAMFLNLNAINHPQVLKTRAQVRNITAPKIIEIIPLRNVKIQLLQERHLNARELLPTEIIRNLHAHQLRNQQEEAVILRPVVQGQHNLQGQRALRVREADREVEDQAARATQEDGAKNNNKK